ncbi:alpha/beta hydrolase family esterase [Nocardia sp. NPDC088792]|uniref:alpha/beta hydrolase family esterase n=1 Tax=Nocardia sp. NPDC088792 TaxID=3364332 RepID=UPI0038301CD1
MANENLVAGELTVDGQPRTYAVRAADRPGTPLVLVLHGNQSELDEPNLTDWSGFAERAADWGITVVYPHGQGGCWADGRGTTTADVAGVDDVAFLRALIEHCAERYGTDPERTLVAGISNGAFMAHRIALEASDRVPVFAAVAGGLPADLSGLRPACAVSAILINGDADLGVPIEGGYSRRHGPNGELRGRTLGLTESAAQWRAFDDCPETGETVTTEQSRRFTSGPGAGGTRVVDWTVFGGGHTWPGIPIPGEWADYPGFAVSLEFHATEEIWRFAEPLLIPADARKL